MPYPRVEPVSEKIMLDKSYHGHFSICQKLRDIYIRTENEEVKLDLRIAMAMAKKMVNKLHEYKTKELNNESINI
jgi:hypothetical protein